MKPDEATKVLAVFEGKLARLKEERDNISKAKEALELAEPGFYYSYFLCSMQAVVLFVLRSSV